MIGQSEQQQREENLEDWLVWYNINLLEVDKTVLMFWYLVKSGLLPKEHIFYEEVKAFFPEP